MPVEILLVTLVKRIFDLVDLGVLTVLVGNKYLKSVTIAAKLMNAS